MRWGGGGGGLISREVYYRQFTVQPASKFSGALWRWGGKKKESLQLRLWNLKTAISRKVVGKNVHKTIPKGNMAYVQYTFPDTVAVKPTIVAFF